MFKLLLVSLLSLPLVALDSLSFAKNIQKSNKMLGYMLKAQNPKAYESYQETLQRKKDREKVLKTPYLVLVYLTSSSVPPEHFIKTALDVGQLKEANVTIMPMMQGMNDSLQGQVQGYRNAMQSYTPKRREIISNASNKMRLTPTLFEALNVDAVPVMVTAKCVGGIPSPERCEIYYVARGETTLEAMALKAALPNKNYLFKEPE
jgi:hypothetical protein